jgi:hypothetical protein
MPYQVHDAVLHAISGTELSRVRTEFRLRPLEPISQRLLASREADIVMQSSEVWKGGLRADGVNSRPPPEREGLRLTQDRMHSAD